MFDLFPSTRQTLRMKHFFYLTRVVEQKTLRWNFDHSSGFHPQPLVLPFVISERISNCRPTCILPQVTPSHLHKKILIFFCFFFVHSTLICKTPGDSILSAYFHSRYWRFKKKRKWKHSKPRRFTQHSVDCRVGTVIIFYFFHAVSFLPRANRVNTILRLE